MDKIVYIGEYSPRCAELYGTVIWLDNNGQEVEITCAFRQGREGSNWEDKRIVSGNLSRYLRQGRVGSNPPARAPIEPYILTEKDFYGKS